MRLARRIEVVAAQQPDRSLALVVLLVAVAWFAYTREYFWLHPRGLTVAPSLFMDLTGRPDPFCGLTRTFAWMWRADVLQAALVYPLGPLVFLGSLAVAGYSGSVLLTGRRLRLRLGPSLARGLLLIAGLALIANWMVKLIWLGI